ncbi:MAG TPA: HEAT repeat domain-containing protein [Ktedonobacteraceae bacterium]
MARQSTKPTLEALQVELADADYKVRKEAIRKLIRYQRALAVEPLLILLEDGRSAVRAKAVEALGRLRDTRAVVPLLGLLKDKSASVRAKVAGTLGNFGERGVVRPLQDLLNDPNPRIRQAAARSLGQLRDPGSLPLLLTYLKQAEEEEFYYLARAVGNFDVSGVIEPLLAMCERTGWAQEAIVEALSRLGESLTPALIEILLDQTRPPAERVCVARVLGKKPRRGIVQPLISVLGDRSADVRQFAAWSLGQLKDPAAIDPLFHLLSDDNEQARQNAIFALIQLQSDFSPAQTEQIIDCLIASLSSDGEYVVISAANMLNKLHATRAVPALLDAVCSEKISFLWPLTSALTALGSPTLVDAVLQRLPDIPLNNLYHVLNIFWHFPAQQAVEPLLALLADLTASGKESNLQIQIVRLLGKLGDPRALEPLRAMNYQVASGTLQSAIRSTLNSLEAAHRQLA